MEPQATLVEMLIERGESYGKTSIELVKLKGLETSTNVVTTLVSRLSVIIMVFLFVLVLNIGIAIWLGELLGKSYYGFFIVAAFYLVAGFVSHLFMYKWIKKPVSELIITQVLQ
jgi:hypothetical protein